MWTVEIADEITRELQSAYESEMTEFFNYEDSAMEGFNSDFNENVSAYMQAIQGINNLIPKAIAHSDEKEIKDLCTKGMKLCDQFRADLKNMPPDKFAKLNNLMPCFKSLMTIAGTVLMLGGASKLGQVPALQPMVKVGAKLFGNSQTNGQLPKVISGIIMWKFPLLQKFLNAGNEAPAQGFFGKFFKASSYLTAGMSAFNSIKNNINQVVEENKYAKAIRQTEGDDKNVANRKYAAMLGQIDEMKAAFKAMYDGAKDMIAEAKKNKESSAQEAYIAAIDDLQVALENDMIGGVLDMYADMMAMEAIAVSGYDEICSRYDPIFREIMRIIPEAIKEKDKKRLQQACDQGIYSAKRMREELKALPADQCAKIKNFIPNFQLLSALWTILYWLTNSYYMSKALFSGAVGQDMKNFGLDTALRLKDANIGVYGQSTTAEIMDAANNVSDVFSAIGSIIDAAGNYVIVPGRFLQKSSKAISTIFFTITKAIETSKYGKIISDQDRDDPNIGNKKYRIALNQLDAMIAMYQNIRQFGIDGETKKPATESWLLLD